MDLPRHLALRYVQPLREGGSLPAVIDTAAGLFVVKFRGAGQGSRALLAELIVALIARRLDLRVPELALVDVSEEFGRGEPDPEIQELLRASHGMNVGLRYLDGAFNFAPAAAGELIDAAFAARVVWLDAFVTNPDRSHRNPNLLIHQRAPWLIDHGAALYVHHDWPSATPERARAPFPLIRDHVLLGLSGDLAEADAECAALLQGGALREVMAAVPDELLLDPVSGGGFRDGEEARARYVDFLEARLAAPRAWVATAAAERERRRSEPPVPVRSRR